MTTPRVVFPLLALVVVCTLSGCDSFVTQRPGLLFSVPLTVDGEDVEDAFVDTGGGYEILLKRAYGLEVVDEVEVLAFGGKEVLDLTSAFSYSVDGYHTRTSGALVGLSVCDCNGVGYHFFRRTGVRLLIDFPSREASFVLAAPPGDATLLYVDPPEVLPEFESAFLEVDMKVGDEVVTVKGLLDTGANVTVVNRDLVASAIGSLATKADISIEHAQLGEVRVLAGLATTPGLPDLIIGTDVMSVWGDRWYFDFTPGQGAVTVIFEAESGQTDGTGSASTAYD